MTMGGLWGVNGVEYRSSKIPLGLSTGGIQGIIYILASGTIFGYQTDYGIDGLSMGQHHF